MQRIIACEAKNGHFSTRRFEMRVHARSFPESMAAAGASLWRGWGMEQSILPREDVEVEDVQKFT